LLFHVCSQEKRDQQVSRRNHLLLLDLFLLSLLFIPSLNEISLPWLPHQECLATLTRDRDGDGLHLQTLPEEDLEKEKLEGDVDGEKDTKGYQGHVLETFLPLLALESFTRSLWSGLVLSLGGLTLSTVGFLVS